MKLRQALSNQAPELYARLQVIEAKARQIAEYAQGGSHLTFTTHGISHISAVEENYNWLLSESDVKQFNPMELFCLLVATLFHDTMMIPPRLGKEVLARAQHAEKSVEFLGKHREHLTLSLHEAQAISEVVRAHGVSDFSMIQAQSVLGPILVDLRKLGACLAVADLCHADASRAPEIVFSHLELDEESAYHWRRHLQISGITRKDHRILVGAICFSNDGERAVQEYKSYIESQLKVVRPYFDSVLWPITGVDLQAQRLKSELDVTMRFKSNTSAILSILIEGVYQRSNVFIRELVQNSLDACHLRRAKAMRRSERYEPQIVISGLKVGKRLKAIRVDDNGIGMDVGDIQDTVLLIGNSISQREDVRSMLSETMRTELIATFGIGLL